MINEIIRSKDMYYLYNTELCEKIGNIKELITKYENTKSYLLANLEICKDYITKFTKVDFDNLKNLHTPIPQLYLGGNPLLKEYADKSYSLISLLVQTNIFLKKEKANLVLEESKVITEQVYKKTIESFNKKISREILKGYTFRVGNRISNIRIKRQTITERSKKRIDWKASLAFKKQLILRGETPYKVLEYDEMKRPIKDNGGVKWFVYHTPNVDGNGQIYDYIWYWEKQNCKILNVKIYKFRPTVNSNTVGGKYELGNANKLKQLQKENSEILKYFNG